MTPDQYKTLRLVLEGASRMVAADVELRLAPTADSRRCWACVWTHPDHPNGGISRGQVPRSRKGTIGWIKCPVCRQHRFGRGRAPMLMRDDPLAGLSESVAMEAVAVCCDMVDALPQNASSNKWSDLAAWWRGNPARFKYGQSLPDVMRSRIQWAEAEDGFNLETWHRRVRACIPLRDPYRDEIEVLAPAAEPVPV